MPKLIDKNLKKEEILLAGIKTFSEKGFHSSTVEDIANKAGIGKGTIYEYFKSKEELILFSLDLYSENTISKLIVTKNSNLTYSKKIHEIIKIHQIDMEEYTEMNPVYFELLNKSSSFGKKFRQKILLIYKKIIRITKEILVAEKIQNSELESIFLISSLEGICQTNILFKFNKKRLNELYSLLEKNFIETTLRKKS